MSVAELREQFKEGKSIAEVAQEKGVDPQSIADTYLAQYKEKLDQAVADEDLTQKQADQMLSNMAEAVAERLEGACGGCWIGGFRARVIPGRGGLMRGLAGWGEL